MTPMMSDKEIFLIDSMLSVDKPKRCLEWGCGGSTTYFPKNHPEIETWVSIEHDEGWYAQIKNEISDNVILQVVKVQDYLNAAIEQSEQGGRFDFILIDGLMRAECLMVAENLLNPGGMVLIHDSGRTEYKKPIKNWSGESEVLSEGEIETKTYAHRGLTKLTL